MLQVQTIRENSEKVINGLKKRGLHDADETVGRLITLDDKRKEAQASLDESLHELNLVSKEIGQLMKSGKREEAEAVKSRSAELKEKGRGLKEVMESVSAELEDLLYHVPNVPNDDVPAGAGEQDNLEIFASGETPVLPEDALPHWDLIRKYDIIDFDLGVKVTGAGFPVYKGKGARLQRAMVNYFLDCAVNAGYVEVQPPVVINQASGLGTGQLPDKEGQMYELTEGGLYLIPTAEVPITNMYRDMILEESSLPVKHAGFTPCFRREAGSWGAHVRGLNRLHQFDKVELVRIEKPENSYQVLREMCSYVQDLLASLDLPYRVLNLCAGDLGFTSAQTFDMEVYSAAQQKWLEVSSVSNFETFQANRLKLRYRTENGKPALLHTLNGSALALPRIMSAILENNQTPDGIMIPEVLVPYTGFDRID